MPKIFISYRREDSQYQADRLHSALKKKIAKRDIFIDVDNIPVGVDFVQHLDTQVAQCDVLLALIGPDWLNARDQATGRRRLDDPKDFVRIEIASALKRGIPVAPILLDGAPFPAEADLPDDLKPLLRRNGVEIRRVSFDTDAERMIRGLLLKPQPAPKPVQPTAQPAVVTPAPAKLAPKRKSGGLGWIAPVIVLALLAAGGGAYLVLANPFGAPPQSPANGEPAKPAAIAAAQPATASTPPASALPSATTPQPAAVAPATITPAPAAPAPPPLDKSPPTYKLEHKLTGHTARVRSAEFSPDSTRVVTASTDGDLRIWDAATGETILKIPVGAAPYEAVYTPDGLHIATTSEDGIARLWDAKTGACLFQVKGIQGDTVMSRDGSLVANKGPKNSIVIWKTSTGERVATLSKPAKSKYDFDEEIKSFAFSPNGSRLVTASQDKTATVWDVRTAKPELTLTGHNSDLTDVTFSPDGSRIATAARDEVVRVSDARTGDTLLTLRHAYNALAWQVAFSPDGKRIVTGANDKTVHVWDAQTGSELLTLSGHAAPVDRVVFSPDGLRILTSSRDGTAIVWDARTGAKLGKLTGHTDYAYARFSPDGLRITTVSAEWIARVWH